VGRRAAGLPRAQQSRRARRDDCIARTMRKSDRTKVPAVAALLLSSDLRLLVRHGCSRAESPARTTASASGDRSAPVSRGGPAYLRSGRSERRRERVRRRSGGRHERGSGRRRSRRAWRRSPVRRSPRAVSSPSSGQGVGDGCAYSRGVPALPTSPSAGLRPIRRRPSRPSPDRASMLGRSGDSLNQQRPTFLTSAASDVKS
jgi:hypothetical protein